MFTIFPGFNLVEAYHEWKKNHKNTKNKSVARAVKLVFCFAVLIVIWCLPLDTFGIEGLTILQKRVMAMEGISVLAETEVGVPHRAARYFTYTKRRK